MIQPNFLRPGDRVGVLSPASCVDTQLLESGLNVLRGWGLEPVLAPYALASYGSLAGTDAQRLSDLQAFLDDDSLQAIICARGGYGITRLLDHLDMTGFLRHPKWVVGFSDITGLLGLLARHGCCSIHGPMVAQFTKMDLQPSVQQLRKLLLEGKAPSLQADEMPYARIGSGSGRLVGGNLSLLADQLATGSMPDLQGCILYIEEVGEYLYHIDRMFTHLQRAGAFDGLAGLAIGQFSDGKQASEKEFPLCLEEIVMEKTAPYHYPVAMNMPFGHSHPNAPLVQGAVYTLTVDGHIGQLEPQLQA